VLRVKKRKRIKVAKKRFYLIVGAALIISIYGFNMFIKQDAPPKDIKASVPVVNNKVSITASNDGSIDMEENSYYQKYTIHRKTLSDAPVYKEENGTINLYLYKNDVENPSLKKTANSTSSNVFIADNENKNSLVILFKENYDKNNQVYLDNKDSKNIIILISKVNNPTKYKVMLDPGHGGRDCGYQYLGVTSLISEKDINLTLVKNTMEELRYNGCEVKLTRYEDKEIDSLLKKDLRMRSDMANEFKADVFVSIHVNSGVITDKNYKSYSGITTFYYGTKGDTTLPERMRLAQDLQDKLLLTDNWNDRKIQNNNLSVLVHSDMPSALIECGFLTNTGDRNRLTNKDTLEKMSKAISQGIIEFLG